MWLVTAQNLQSIKKKLNLELDHYQKSGSTSS